MAARGKHILVLNDTAEILDLFRELLEEEGYRVTTGSMVPGGLAQSFAEVKDTQPNLLVLDYLFGYEDLGWQLLQMLRMDPATARLPIVVCTAAARQVAELSAHLSSLNVGVILKPFDLDALLSEIERVLERTAADQAADRRSPTAPADAATSESGSDD